MRRPLLNISAAKKLKGFPSSAIKENESRNGRSGNIQGRFWGRRRITTLEMITFSLFDGSAEGRWNVSPFFIFNLRANVIRICTNSILKDVGDSREGLENKPSFLMWTKQISIFTNKTLSPHISVKKRAQSALELRQALGYDRCVHTLKNIFRCILHWLKKRMKCLIEKKNCGAASMVQWNTKIWDETSW